jgi:hypothetical protein
MVHGAPASSSDEWNEIRESTSDTVGENQWTADLDVEPHFSHQGTISNCSTRSRMSSSDPLIHCTSESVDVTNEDLESN